MKTIPVGSLVLAITISMPLAGFLTEKLSAYHSRNLLEIEYKSKNPVTLEAFYQKDLRSPYTKSSISTSFRKNLKEGSVCGKILLPAGKLSVLRLDFGSAPGKVEISKLAYRSKNISADILKKSNFVNISNIQFPEKDIVHFTSKHIDPYIVFNPQLTEKAPFPFWYFAAGVIIFVPLLFLLFLQWEKWTRPRE